MSYHQFTATAIRYFGVSGQRKKFARALPSVHVESNCSSHAFALILEFLFEVSSIRKDLAHVAFDLIDRFHISSLKLSISHKLKAVGASKHWLLLPVKLRMTELNAWKNMSLGPTFRCMCNYGFCFEVYVNMTVFVAWFDFRIFGCMHNLKQTYDSVLKTVA